MTKLEWILRRQDCEVIMDALRAGGFVVKEMNYPHAPKHLVNFDREVEAECVEALEGLGLIEGDTSESLLDQNPQRFVIAKRLPSFTDLSRRAWGGKWIIARAGSKAAREAEADGATVLRRSRYNAFADACEKLGCSKLGEIAA